MKFKSIYFIILILPIIHLIVFQIKKQSYLTPIRPILGVPQEHAMVLYAGNIGIMQQLDPIVDSACSLRDLPIHFVFIGEGEKKSELIKRTDSEKLTNVHFLRINQNNNLPR